MKFLLTLLVTVCTIVAVSTSVLEKLPSFFTETLILLVLTTSGLYYFLLNIRKKRPEHFVLMYLLTLVVKLLAVGAFVFLMFIQDPDGAAVNAVFVLVCYFIFTLLEVGFLYLKVDHGKGA